MPVAPDEFTFLTAAKDDLFDIAEDDSEAGGRIRDKIEELREQTIQWGRVPQAHLTYLSDAPPEYNFYRQTVGKSGHRVIYAIDADEMLVVAVLPRTDRTYQMDRLVDRIDRYEG